MNNTQIPETLLTDHICGFHTYSLNPPYRLRSVGQSLCDMLGCTKAELLSDAEDLYLSKVHPADRSIFEAFLASLASREGQQNAEYRLICASGKTIFVRDTADSKKAEDGSMIAVSSLSDISALKKENEDLHFLNETIPCGFLRYTCEKQPRVTYINQQMQDILRFPKESQTGELDYLEMYKDNIFLMVPMEERRHFAKYLNRVYTADAPLAGDMTLLRCDGTRAHVFGWVIKHVNENGEEEFQSACMDITERYRSRQNRENQKYIQALTDVYDKIFEYDLSNNTLKCLYAENSPVFKHLQNISMQMEDATQQWLDASVAEEDRERVHKFFKDFYLRRLFVPGEKPPTITYTARSSSGEMKAYSGIFLRMDDAVSLFCCRPMAKQSDHAALADENASLKQNMKEMFERFTDGIAAFEVTPDGLVTPLYLSDNICEFFGYSKDEWLPLMDKTTPLREFVRQSDTSYEDFTELLRTGEAQFTYYDLHSECERSIKAICSQKTPGNAPRYIMLYNVESTLSPAKKSLTENRTVSVRTFGYFDVFVGDQPISFRNKKAQELFAILVDRKGGFVSSQEAIGYLWEDETVNTVTLARYRKVALRLKNTLEEYGISDVVESVDGNRRIVPERIECDLYNYLSDKQEYANLFKGSYLTNYSWGETTLAELCGSMYSNEE